MDLIHKLEQFKLDTSEKVDVEYLKSEEIGNSN